MLSVIAVKRSFAVNPVATTEEDNLSKVSTNINRCLKLDTYRARFSKETKWSRLLESWERVIVVLVSRVKKPCFFQSLSLNACNDTKTTYRSTGTVTDSSFFSFLSISRSIRKFKDGDRDGRARREGGRDEVELQRQASLTNSATLYQYLE